MTNAEAPFSVTFKVPPRDRDGDLFTARGETIEEFEARVEQLETFLAKRGNAAPSVAQATQALANAGLVDPANPGTGLPTVAQPAAQPQAAPAADGPPPGLEHPGNCAHNLPRVYGAAFKSKGGKQISARWECGIPWAAGAATNDSRCKPIYIKD